MNIADHVVFSRFFTKTFGGRGSWTEQMAFLMSI